MEDQIPEKNLIGYLMLYWLRNLIYRELNELIASSCPVIMLTLIVPYPVHPIRIGRRNNDPEWISAE
jgi:hypothetical protein